MVRGQSLWITGVKTPILPEIQAAEQMGTAISKLLGLTVMVGPRDINKFPLKRTQYGRAKLPPLHDSSAVDYTDLESDATSISSEESDSDDIV